MFPWKRAAQKNAEMIVAGRRTAPAHANSRQRKGYIINGSPPQQEPANRRELSELRPVKASMSERALNSALLCARSKAAKVAVVLQAGA